MRLNRNLIICFLSITLFSGVGWGVESGSSPELKGVPLTRGSVWTPGEAVTSARSERGVLVLLRSNLRRVERQNLHRRFPEGFRYLVSRSNRVAARPSSHVLRLPVMDRLIWTETPKGVSRARFIEECEQYPEVASAEPDRMVSLAVDAEDAEDAESVHPDDFSFSKQWHLHNTGQTKGTEDADIDALEAWTIQTGNPQIQVAVIDTGIDYFHPDLEANIWLNSLEIPGNGIDDDGNGYIDDVHGYDFVSDDSDPMDDHQHGTHVSGIIGAKGNNGIGVSGVCWDVRLMAVKAFDDSGSTELSRVIEAIQYAVQNGAQIINASWGLDDPSTSDALEALVREVRSLGILFVAAAGNADDDEPFFPASYPEVLSVGATDHKDKKASFSNFGEFVDLAAPGRNIFSTLPNADYGNLSGTSMAVPQVVGLAALIISSHPEFTPEDIANIMINRVDPVRSKQSVGSGRINAYEALRVEAPLPVADLEISDTLAGVLPITGQAGGIDFRSYTLEIGEGEDPESFELIFASDEASVNGILMPAFVTSDFGEGTYTIRLSVLDVLGQESTDRKTIQVDNIRITGPRNNDLIAADSMIVVHGSVFGESLEYRFEYGKGFNPSVWESDAIAVAEPNGGNLEDAPLGLWDLRRLDSDQFYSLRLTAFRGDTEIDVDLVHMIYLDGRMRAGWPQYLPVQGDYPPEDWRFVKCQDLDQDGFQEIIIVDHGNEDGLPAVLVVFNHNGQVQWRTELGSGIPFTDVPLVVDLDGDGFFEIYVEAGSERKLYAFDHQGQPLSGNWPLDLAVGDLGKSAADLNGDGILELIGLSQDYFIKDGERKRLLLVVNHNGDILAEWELPFCSVEEDVPEIMPVVGNLDADADLEIVVVSGCNTLEILNLDQPGKIHRTIEIDGILLSSPVVGDLDGDGKNEIIVSSFDENDELQGGIYVFDSQGELVPGWPVLVEESFSVSPALADFDQDGDLEICIPGWSSKRVHLLHHFGFEAEGWPVGPFPSTHLQSGPVIGDIDGDGALDVVLATQGVLFHTIRTGDMTTIGGIQAWSFSGDSIDLNSHPKVTSLIMESTSSQPWLKSSPVTLTDLDGNGFLDVVATSIQDAEYGPGDPPAVRKNRSSIYVWEFDVPFSQSAFPWPAFMGGSGQNGYVEPVPILNAAPVLGLIPDQVVLSGEPFFPLELDRYVEDANDGPLGLSWSISGNRQLEVFIDREFIAYIAVSDASWTGEESLKFVARDPDGLSSETWVRFRVVSGVELPIAVDDFVEVQEDASFQFNPLLNDRPGAEGESLEILGFNNPISGSVSRTSIDTLIYKPHSDFSGFDSFHYFLIDENGNTSIATVRLDVLPVNDAPQAENDHIILLEDTPVFLNLLANDRDVDGDLLVIQEFDLPENGSLILDINGLLRYSPNEDFFGIDRFRYEIVDGNGLRSEAQATMRIKPVNDGPTIQDHELTLNKNSALNFTLKALDVEGDKLSYRVIDGPENGILWAFPSVVRYIPDDDYVGSDLFTYLASDGKVDSRVASVSVTILDANNPPEIRDVDLAVKPNRDLHIQLTGSDLDGNELTFEILEFPLHGELDGDGSVFTYRSEVEFLGMDSLVYQATDGENLSEPATVSIEVTDLNTPPVSKNLSLKTNVDTELIIDLKALDRENDLLQYEILTFPRNGSLRGVSPKLIYSPENGFSAMDEFSFFADDGEEAGLPATVTISVRFINNEPVAEDQFLRVLDKGMTEIELVIEDENVDALRTAILKGPEHGRVAGIGTHYVYFPEEGFLGNVEFTYKVWDGLTYGNEGKVSLQVTDSLLQISETIEYFELSDEQVPRITLQTRLGNRFEIQVSIDLIHWESLQIIEIGRGEDRTVTDADGFGQPRRFYRALLLGRESPDSETGNDSTNEL